MTATMTDAEFAMLKHRAFATGTKHDGYNGDTCPVYFTLLSTGRISVVWEKPDIKGSYILDWDHTAQDKHEAMKHVLKHPEFARVESTY